MFAAKYSLLIRLASAIRTSLVDTSVGYKNKVSVHMILISLADSADSVKRHTQRMVTRNVCSIQGFISIPRYYVK